MSGPSISLNHLYVRTDEATFATLVASPFLREQFCGTTVSETVTTERRSWNGLYLFGEHTYLEIFSPASALEQVGDSGIALATEQPNDINATCHHLQQAGFDTTCELFERMVDGQPVPWLHNAALISAERHLPEPFCAWIMEIDASFLHRTRGTDEGVISSKAYNAPNFAAGKYLQDITAIHLAISDSERSIFSRQLEALGFQVSQDRDDLVLTTRHLAIRLSTATSQRYGVLSIGLTLRHDYQGPSTVHFGRGARIDFLAERQASMLFMI